jgi:hypothetical protein
MEFKKLLNISRNPNDEAKKALTAEMKKGAEMVTWGSPSAERDVIRKSLLSSSDPIIAAYVLADKVLHVSYMTPDQLIQVK